MASDLQLSTPPPLSPQTAIPFCPTKQVNQVGLDYMQLLKVSLDWPGLVQPIPILILYLCTIVLLAQLPKETLVSRLGNRWEFQEDAWLDADESSLLSIIRSKITT